MPADLAELLHPAAPETTRSLDPEGLWRAGQYRRRHRRLAVIVAILVVAGFVVVGVSWLDAEADRVVTAPDSILVGDSTHGFSIEYPATWHRASTSLTPGLADPVEIVSLGTGDLVPGSHSCAQFPVAALEAMGRTDAFITVQERLSPHAAGLAPGQPFDETKGFPDRPDGSRLPGRRTPARSSIAWRNHPCSTTGGSVTTIPAEASMSWSPLACKPPSEPERKPGPSSTASRSTRPPRPLCGQLAR
jgi:hypothetical protein